MTERDKHGRSLKAVLTREEMKRLDALWQARDLSNEMAQARRLLDKLVADARKANATWAEIGQATGMSPQSAHSRWSPKSTEKSATPGNRTRTPSLPLKREVQSKLSV
jgi:hypothetical protein